MRARKHGIYHATIYFDTKDLALGPIETVDIFGEFTDNSREGPWGRMVRCEKSTSSVTLFSANIDIKFGQKFKFVIDNGRQYAVSDYYPLDSDNAGNTNNIYKFLPRMRDSSSLGELLSSRDSDLRHKKTYDDVQ